MVNRLIAFIVLTSIAGVARSELGFSIPEPPMPPPPPTQQEVFNHLHQFDPPPTMFDSYPTKVDPFVLPSPSTEVPISNPESFNPNGDINGGSGSENK